ncbi:MAG: hypothetical protein P8H45_06195 [Flavobacteriaceae bacterium]|nr:hypothetical protein [Flavobacteriaceae bacterium]
MIYVFMVLTGLIIAFIFNIFFKLKIRSLYIFSVVGSFIGSLAIDPNQFSLVASLVGAVIVVFIVCSTQRA